MPEGQEPAVERGHRKFVIPEANLVKVINYINNSILPAREANQLVQLLKQDSVPYEEPADPGGGKKGKQPLSE